LKTIKDISIKNTGLFIKTVVYEEDLRQSAISDVRFYLKEREKLHINEEAPLWCCYSTIISYIMEKFCLTEEDIKEEVK